MSILDNMAKWTKKQASSLSDEVKKIKNKKFMEATVAGCALVAFADGIVKPQEKEKMAGFIRRSEALNAFNMTDVINSFEKYVQGFEFDRQIGKAEALNTISKIKKNSEEARLLVRVCCAVGIADGDFDENEQNVVREICHELELNPSEFGLSASSSQSNSSSSLKDKDAGIPEWMRK